MWRDAVLSRFSCCLSREDDAKPCHARHEGHQSGGGSEYLEREDVRELLEELKREQPEDLHSWLQQYGSDQEEGVQPVGSVRSLRETQAFNVEAGYELLDWRFFILNKEKEIFTLTKKVWARSLAKGHSPCKAGMLAFLPDMIREAIASGRISLDDQQLVVNTSPNSTSYNPIISKFDAAVVFLDASGFTALTEALARTPRGAEEIGACLNGFFTPLIEVVRSFGGDILKFSGDAITILWPVPAYEGNTPEGVSPSAAAALAACRCCIELQAKVKAVGQMPLPGITLAVHIGVGFGRLCLLQLGGLVDRWEFCAAGVPLEEVAIAEPSAKPGETVLSPSITDLVGLEGEHGLSIAASDGLPEGYCYLTGAAEPSKLVCSASTDKTVYPDLDARLVKRYVPKAIRSGLTSDAMGYDAEMRRIAVIFLSIQGMLPGKDDSDAHRTQLMMRLFQRSVYALEGSINKFMVDDKGMVLLVVFGLPPVNHYTDDPIRAALTATRLCDTLQDEGLVGSAGVATGTCWCGVVGSNLRKEYTVLGDTVNLSARLMARAQPGTVLVDSATFEASRSSLEFRYLGSIFLKGKSKETELYQFMGRVQSRQKQRMTQMESPLHSWGDWPVRAELERALDAQLTHPAGPGGIVFVKGGPGCGKTEAVHCVEQWAMSRNFSLLYGQNMNPTSTFSVPRLCWQEVFGALLESAGDDLHWRRQVSSCSMFTASSGLYQLVLKMLTAVDAGPDLLCWSPLLSFVLPGINFGAKGVSALLERDEMRTRGPPRLAELCSYLVDSFTRFNSDQEGTVVLVHIKSGTSVYKESYIHDDNIARAIGELCLSRRARANGRPLIFCLVSRDKVLPDSWLVDHASASDGLVSARDLDRSETEQYMAHLLLADAGVSPSLVDHVYDACGGNPYCVEVLSRQLQNEELLQRTPEGLMEPAEGAQLRKLRYPEDLKGIALASFEKLRNSDQRLLKTAAVCCQDTTEHSAENEFSVLDLVLYTGTGSPQDVEAQCGSLAERRIFAEVRDGSGAAQQTTGRKFRFVSGLLKYVASTLVLEVQKQALYSRANSRTVVVRASTIDEVLNT